MLFCQTKDKVTIKYAVSTTKKPIGVADYKLKIAESLLKELRGHLPTVKEIEAALAKDSIKANLLNKDKKQKLI